MDLEADGLNNQGVSYFDLGRKEEAVSCWKKALQMNQFHPEATYNFSLMQWRDGKIDDVEALTRVENCGKTPMVSKTALNEMLASIHCERFDPRSAKRLLKDNENIYYAVLRGKEPDQLQELKVIRGHSDKINALSVTPDGKTCLSGGGVYGYGSDCSLRVWDLESFECIRVMERHSRQITALAVTPDGKHAITGSSDNTVRFWKIKTGKCIWSLKELGVIHSVTSTRDGRYIIIGDSSSVKLWRIGKRKMTRYLSSGKYQRTILSVDVSEDSQIVLSGRLISRSKGNIGISKIKSGERIGQFNGHTGAVNIVRIFGNDKFVISGSDDNTLKLWDMKDKECIRTFIGHNGGVTSVAVFGQNNFAISGSKDNTLKIWDLNSGQCIRTLVGHADEITSLGIFADERFAISASKDKTMRVWKMPRVSIFRADPKLAVPVDFAALKQKQHMQELSFNEALKLYRNGRFKQSYALLLDAWKQTGYSNDKAISELYENLAVKGRISAFSFANRMTDLRGHSAPILSFAMPEKGNLAISGSDDNTIGVWNIETSECKRILKGHRKGVASVVVLDSGKFAVSGSWDKTIKLWNVDTAECVRTLKGHTEGINSVALIGDGSLAVSCSWDKTVRIWKLETGECIRVVKGHTHSVHCVAVDRNGELILSASQDETIRIWNLATDRCVWTLEGHAGAITTATFLNDGRSVLSGSEDKTLKLWDLKRGECIVTLHGHENAVTSVNVTSDGRFAMSSGKDMTVRIWDLDKRSCMYRMENQHGGENLTALIGDHRFATYGNPDNCASIWRIVWDYTFD